MCVWEISTALLLNCDEGSKWTSFRPAEKGRPEQTSYKIFVWSKTRLTKIKLSFIRPSSFTWRNAIPVPTAPRIYNWLSVKLSSFMMQPPCMCEKVKMKWFFFFFCQLSQWSKPNRQVFSPPHCRCWMDGPWYHRGHQEFYSSCQEQDVHYLLSGSTHCLSSLCSCYCRSTWTKK